MRERDTRWPSPGETKTVDGRGQRKRKQMLMTKRKQMALTKSERETIDGHDQGRETVDGHDQNRNTVGGHDQERETQPMAITRGKRDSRWP